MLSLDLLFRQISQGSSGGAREQGHGSMEKSRGNSVYKVEDNQKLEGDRNVGRS